MKLAKYIAHCGICSRRKAETLIAEGHVAVNNTITTNVATRIASTDRVHVDGNEIQLTKTTTTIMLNKPVGVVSTCRDDQQRTTVLDLLPKELHHLKPIGRLDKNTEGLILLTNDGDLHHQLTHPSFHCEKEYIVTVKGHLSNGAQEQLEKGIVIELDNNKTYRTQPATLHSLTQRKTTTQFHLVITEGKKRQIRKMCEAAGYPVTHLKRSRMGKLQLHGLAKGKWKTLQEKDLKALQP